MAGTAENLAAQIALFLIGSVGGISLQRAWRSVRGQEQAWQTVWQDTVGLLADRRRTIPLLAAALPPHRAALLAALSDLPPLPPPRVAPTAALLASEQHLSGLILHLARADDAPDLLPHLLELETDERRLAALRENFNRHAGVWNDLRTGFPIGLLARAMLPDALPLWEGA